MSASALSTQNTSLSTATPNHSLCSVPPDRPSYGSEPDSPLHASVVSSARRARADHHAARERLGVSSPQYRVTHISPNHHVEQHFSQQRTPSPTKDSTASGSPSEAGSLGRHAAHISPSSNGRGQPVNRQRVSNGSGDSNASEYRARISSLKDRAAHISPSGNNRIKAASERAMQQRRQANEQLVRQLRDLAGDIDILNSSVDTLEQVDRPEGHAYMRNAAVCKVLAIKMQRLLVTIQRENITVHNNRLRDVCETLQRDCRRSYDAACRALFRHDIALRAQKVQDKLVTLSATWRRLGVCDAVHQLIALNDKIARLFFDMYDSEEFTAREESKIKTLFALSQSINSAILLSEVIGTRTRPNNRLR